MTGVLDPVHRFRLNALDMCVPDGQPVRWALNSLRGCHLTDRVYGPELMLRVCARAASEGLSIYLYGSTSEVLSKLRENLVARIPGLSIAGSSPSRFRKISPEEKAAAVREIRSSGAAIVFCGLGCPRQEVWAYEYREALGMPIVAVGAAFDFFAGRMPQAPKTLQRYGLEWAFRLYSEPRRLWRRYLLLNPLYLSLLAAEALRLRNFSDVAPAPQQEVGFG
jgi:exopolysaccharide biosynthesis WecB/TagA/CpsF family protein